MATAFAWVAEAWPSRLATYPSTSPSVTAAKGLPTHPGRPGLPSVVAARVRAGLSAEPERHEGGVQFGGADGGQGTVRSPREAG